MGILDLFCGTGGFSTGVARGLASDAKVTFGIDLLEESVATFAANHPRAVALAGDIREWGPQRVEDVYHIRPSDVDIVVGGPPCQGFSSIRPHRSSTDEDERNGLYQDFLDYVEHFEPRAFVMENVVGLATHNGGKTIRSIHRSFGRRGYTSDWRILNAANYGVPQRRERLVMVGVKRGDVVFPAPTHRSNGRAIGHRDRERMVSPNAIEYAAGPLPKAVSAWEAISDLPAVRAGEGATTYRGPPQNEFQRRMRGNSDFLTMHDATGHTERMLDIIRHSGHNISSIPAGKITSGFSSCYSRIDAHLPSVTLTVNFVHPASNKCVHPYQDRALTPREGARIQSFDDAYRFAGSRTRIVKQIGNAVPPLLGEALGRALRGAGAVTAGEISPLARAR